MKITTELRPSYCLISKNKTTFDHLRSTRIVRESPEDECWKWKCRYKVMFENEQDFKDAFLFYGRSDFNGSLSNEELLKFLSVKYFKNKKLILRQASDYYLYYWKRNYIDHPIYYVCIKEDGEVLTDVSKKEQALWDKRNEIKNNETILDAFFKNNLRIICKKYGLKLYSYRDYNPNITFDTKKSFIKFVNTMLQNTVIKELKEIGLAVALDETALSKMLHSIWSMSDDLLMNGIVLDKEKLNN